MPTPHPRPREEGPRLRLLSLGAGVQSSALLLLAAHGAIPRFDAALFADTGWEPAAVYRHLQRLEAIAGPVGIPVLRLSAGNIRHDALDSAHRFASMPLFITGPHGQRGMGRRQCTAEYKIRPLKRQARRLLGYPHPARIPPRVYAEQAIGISTDEFHRAKDADVRYLRNRFWLLEMGWSRRDCQEYLSSHGLAHTPKSACVGCPFRSNASWAHLRASDPHAWQDAVAFDHAIRHGHPAAPLRGTAYLHPARIPLEQVNLDVATGPDPQGCSPWACRGSEATEGEGEAT